MPTEPPPAPPVTVPPPPPQAGDDVSRSIFQQARIDAGLDQPVPAPTPEPSPSPAPAPDAIEPPPGPAKSAIPDDVLDPDAPPTTAVHDAVAEIQAAELPKGAKKEQIDSFGKLKDKAAKHLQTALDHAAELEKKIGSGDATKAELAALNEKLTAANAKAAEIEERWSKEAYASSPQFRAKFADREQTALDLAKTYLDGTEIKADIIDLAAHATGRKRVELLKDAGVDDATIQLISPHLANFDTVQREKSTALANWKAASQAEREQAHQEQERARAARSEQENRVWDTVITKLDLLPFRESKDHPDWNARRELLLAEAKRRYNGDGADLPVFAETIAKGVAYDVQQEVLDHVRNENKSLREENARLKSAAPGGQLSSGTRDGAPVDTSKMSREDQAKATFNQQKALAGAQ